MAKFRHVLQNRDFFLLWIGQIISQIGDRLGQMALISFVYTKAPGSSLEIAKILSFTIIPVFLIGPVAGVYVDRWDRRKTLYISDFLRTILVLLVVLFLFYYKNLGVAYFTIFLLFCVGRFFVPAKLAIIPDLVRKEDLLIANSLVNVTGMIAAILGFGVSGILVEWLKAKGGLYLDAFSFFASAALIFLISKKSYASVWHLREVKEIGKDIVEVIKKSVAQEIKEGSLYLIQKKDIRFSTGIIFILWSALGAVYVVMIAFVQKTLHSATKDLGLLIMFLGLGLFLGSLIYGRFGERLSHYKIIFASLVSNGIMLICFALTIQRYPDFKIAAGLSFVLGLLISPIMIASNTIIHNVSDNIMMGKVFSSLEIVMHLGFLLFMFISGMLAERFSQPSILVIVGGLFIILGLINFISKRKIPWLN
jgi:MFS transporter, DHA3 family, macrolide efflux protein